MAEGGSHPLLKEAARRFCAARGLGYAELSHGWVLRLGKGAQARFVHGFDLGLNTRLAAKAADDKYLAALMWHESGVPHVPRALLVSPGLFARLGRGGDWRCEMRAVLGGMAAKGWHGALVLKPNEGRGGEDVVVCADTGEAEARLPALFERHETLCAEPWMPAARECRFVVLDGAVLLAFAKVVDCTGLEGGGHGVARLHNLSREGRIAPLLPEEEALAEMAVGAAAALGLRFCTLDILVREGGPLVLEANANVTLARAAETLGRERVLRVYEKAIARVFEAPSGHGP